MKAFDTRLYQILLAFFRDTDWFSRYANFVFDYYTVKNGSFIYYILYIISKKRIARTRRALVLVTSIYTVNIEQACVQTLLSVFYGNFRFKCYLVTYFCNKFYRRNTEFILDLISFYIMNNHFVLSCYYTIFCFSNSPEIRRMKLLFLSILYLVLSLFGSA